MKTTDQNGKITAFNYIFVGYAFGFLLTASGFVYNLVTEGAFSWLLLIMAVVFLAVLLFDALYFTFTKEKITSVTILGIKTDLRWSSVLNITKCGFWESVKELPHYSIIHNENYKGKITQTETKIPLTPKTKKCIKAFYSGEVIGEDLPRLKKR